MNLHDKVSEFNTEYGIKHHPIIRVLDLVSELGELSKEFLKDTDYEIGEIQTSHDIELEVGDIYYSLISLANEMDLNLENCLNLALEKYTRRFELNGDFSSFK